MTSSSYLYLLDCLVTNLECFLWFHKVKYRAISGWFSKCNWKIGLYISKNVQCKSFRNRILHLKNWIVHLKDCIVYFTIIHLKCNSIIYFTIIHLKFLWISHFTYIYLKCNWIVYFTILFVWIFEMGISLETLFPIFRVWPFVWPFVSLSAPLTNGLAAIVTSPRLFH